MAREDLIKQYNAAGERVNKAVETLGKATEEERSACEQEMRDATADFERIEGNLQALDGGEKTAKRFQPIAAAPIADPSDLGMDEREVRSYSIVRAIRAAVDGDWSNAQLEREASDEIAKRTGKAASGFYVPSDVQRAKRDFSRAASMRRDAFAGLNGGTSGGGAALVDDTLLYTSLVELLRNKMQVRAAGAQVLSGLTGNIKIPRQTGASTFYWVGRNGAVAASTPNTDQIPMSPHTGGAGVDIGRDLLKQSSIDIDSFVMLDIATVCALGIDAAGLIGTGADDQPTGIAHTDGVNPITFGGEPTWAKLVEMESAISAANADVSTMAYLFNALTRGALKTIPKVAGYPVFLWENGAEPVNGYRALITNQLPSDLGHDTDRSAGVFGDFSQLIIGMWGTMDILVDPNTLSRSGCVRVTALQDVDIAVRHPEAFSYASDIVTTVTSGS